MPPPPARPEFWTSSDAEIFEDGKCPIDWELIDQLREELEMDGPDLFKFFYEKSLEQDPNDPKLVAYMQCQGMALLREWIDRTKTRYELESLAPEQTSCGEEE